ncbi:hypothetical protein BJ508DRAFT_75769 [Ascobolus immersus RN42]|uniref:Uncharacterized protein n=1 Tax=Ascobolus immersus RN42 TaxID=1160509 RepID=A0A3N4HH08_ASCIM|nr:hypothetical protein BJ508DRAFT_75769 [Ascobolus immersus RN42]
MLAMGGYSVSADIEADPDSLELLPNSSSADEAMWHEFDTEEAIFGSTTLLKEAHNISLNLHHGVSYIELWLTVLAGILVQSSVLILAAFTVYHPRSKGMFLKGDSGSPALGHAVPLLLVGTMLLSLGLWICTTIIERSTEETVWRRSSPKRDSFAPSDSNDAGGNCASQTASKVTDTEEIGSGKGDLKREYKTAHIMWLQKHHVVNDQTFASALILPRAPHEEFLYSRRRKSKKLAQPRRRIRDWRSLQMLQRLTRPSTQIITVMSTVVSLLGFFCQFQAIRDLHWSISLAQLLAMALMTGLRALLRRGISIPPLAKEIPEDHILDWLATTSLRPSSANTPSKGLYTYMSIGWKFETRLSTGAYRAFLSHSYPVPNDADYGYRTVNIRRRLAQLTKYKPTPEVSVAARKLRKTISELMDTIFPKGFLAAALEDSVTTSRLTMPDAFKASSCRDANSIRLASVTGKGYLTWAVPVACTVEGPLKTFFTVQVSANSGDGNKAIIDLEELESTISLSASQIRAHTAYRSGGRHREYINLGPVEDIPLRRALAWFAGRRLFNRTACVGGREVATSNTSTCLELVVGFRSLIAEEQSPQLPSLRTIQSSLPE